MGTHRTLAVDEGIGLDSLRRLLRVNKGGAAGEDEGWSYDEQGNILAWSKPGSYRAFSYDAADQLVADGLGAYAYDVDGNLTHDSGGRDYAWDAADRLVQAQVPVPNSSAKAFRLDYAANNLRVRKTDNGGAVTNYLYDGLQLLAETDASGAVKKLYNPGVSVTDDSGNKFYYLINGRGDTADLIDRDGNIVDAYSYDVYGATIGGANSNGLRYVSVGGVYSDDELGLQYMWNRWYDPELGRFISRDPSGFAGGLNLYGYASNNPLNRIDPFGLADATFPVDIPGYGPYVFHLDQPYANQASYYYGATTWGAFTLAGSTAFFPSDPFSNAMRGTLLWYYDPQQASYSYAGFDNDSLGWLGTQVGFWAAHIDGFLTGLGTLLIDPSLQVPQPNYSSGCQ